MYTLRTLISKFQILLRIVRSVRNCRLLAYSEEKHIYFIYLGLTYNILLCQKLNEQQLTMYYLDSASCVTFNLSLNIIFSSLLKIEEIYDFNMVISRCLV